MAAHIEYVKHRKGKQLRSGKKQIVLNVFSKFCEKYLTLSIQDIVNLTTLQWLKKVMIEWMDAKRIGYSMDMVKDELIEQIKTVNINKKFDKYVVDSMAEQACHTVLRLPPCHCVFNPIEAVGSKIDNLFCMGSPLSVFLALRLRDPQAPGHVETILPPSLCNNFYNVFHPSDPVAYRMEPLLLRDYSRIAPLQIQAYNAVTHVDYSDMPLEPLLPEIASSATNTTAATTKRREGLDELESDSPSNTPSKDCNFQETEKNGIQKKPDLYQ
ncbi:hypothetical protein ANN_06520 [Periplaneta americana]|uniref:DDHD domain-containing protein n=1 Tax=Periplaneta americana TaxID=6978 RepID=A0ABQ8TFJ4_PERAM|nr:hypothetical protein ANN_06520 [Periplaneta americana]